MSEFSDRLEQYISQTGLGEGQLAKATGFSRSYIARLKNGQRISPDTKKMIRLFDALSLPAEEYAQLWNLYLKERMGREKYDLNIAVLDFIGSFRTVSRLSKTMRIDYEIPNLRMVKGREDVDDLIRLVIGKESRKQDGYLRLVLQPDCRCALEALKAGMKENERFRADHLVCMESFIDQRQEKYHNIQLLGQILPVLLCSRPGGYQVYYYYDRIQAHYSRYSMMPYYVISSEYVVNIDYHYECAIIYREANIQRIYAELFDQMTKSCRPMYQHAAEDFPVLIDSIKNCQKSENGIIYYMGAQPCQEFFMPDSFYNRLGLDENGQEAGKCRAEQRKVNGKQGKEKNQKCVFYFTQKGIDRLLREGHLDGFLMGSGMMLEQTDRLALADMFIRSADEGSCELYLMDDSKFQYPEGLTICAGDFENVLLYYQSEESEDHFMIKEKTLAKLLYDFMENFRENEGLFLQSQEETIRYIKTLSELAGR